MIKEKDPQVFYPDPEPAADPRDSTAEARAFLSRARLLDKLGQSRLREIEYNRCLATRTTAAITDDPVAHTRNVSSMEDAIIRLNEAREALQTEVITLVDVRCEISDALSHIRSDTIRLVLEERYLEFLSWEEIAEDFGRTPRWAFDKQRKGLEILQRIITEQRQTA